MGSRHNKRSPKPVVRREDREIVRKGPRIRMGMKRTEAFVSLRKCPADMRGDFYVTPIHGTDRDEKTDILAIGWRKDAADGVLSMRPLALDGWSTWSAVFVELHGDKPTYFKTVWYKYAPYSLYLSLGIDGKTVFDASDVVRIHRRLVNNMKEQRFINGK